MKRTRTERKQFRTILEAVREYSLYGSRGQLRAKINVMLLHKQITGQNLPKRYKPVTDISTLEEMREAVNVLNKDKLF